MTDISRRGVLKGAAATGLILGASAMPAAASTPKPGGKLRVALGHGQTSDSLDPGSHENGFTSALVFSYANYLTEVGPDGNLRAELAESWEASADASEWTFKIRKATFHDGRAITAKDVIASINHHRGAESKSAAKPIVAAIKELSAVGEDAVKFVLEAGNADFPFIVTDYHLAILPAKEDGTLDWQSGVGSGAFKLANFEPGKRADLVKFDGYWKPGLPYFDEIEMLSIVDPVARLNAIATGAVDVIDRVETKSFTLIERNPNLVLHSATGTRHYTFPMRVNAEPFTDNNVRLALKNAINRQEMLDKILAGAGQLGNDLPIGPNQRFFNKDLPQREFDADKAKFHWEKTGLGDTPVTLIAANAAFPGAVDAAQLYANSAKQAGINIKVERAADDGYWSNIWNKKAWCACYWGGRPVEDLMFSTAYQSGADWNDTAFTNERFDALLLQARAELNEDNRRAMYFEMQEILHNEGGLICPMFSAYVTARTKAVGVADAYGSNWDLDGNRFAERWWFS